MGTRAVDSTAQRRQRTQLIGIGRKITPSHRGTVLVGRPTGITPQC